MASLTQGRLRLDTASPMRGAAAPACHPTQGTADWLALAIAAPRLGRVPAHSIAMLIPRFAVVRGFRHGICPMRPAEGDACPLSAPAASTGENNAMPCEYVEVAWGEVATALLTTGVIVFLWLM